MRLSAALPPGVTALFFDAARARRRLEARLAAALEEEGFAEVVLPILDYLEPYQELLADSGSNELYRFVDRGGELLALRADFTPMLARLLAPRLAALELPLRLFYRGDVVRYQEEQAGRLREFYQVGAELLGEGGEAADRELLTLFLRLLQASGAPSVQVVLGFAGALDELLADAAAGRAGAGAGAATGELAAAVERRQRQVARRASPALLEVVEHGLPADPAALGPEAGERLTSLLALTRELAQRFPAVRISIDLAEFARLHRDPRLAGGGERSYYDGTVFRAFVGRRALPVGAGGRYDRLFARLGAELPAAGFSLGVDRLLQVVDDERTAS